MQVYYESDPDDTADVILLDHDVRQIRCVYVRLQEQLEKHNVYMYFALFSLCWGANGVISVSSVQCKHECLYNLPAAEGF